MGIVMLVPSLQDAVNRARSGLPSTPAGTDSLRVSHKVCPFARLSTAPCSIALLFGACLL